MSLHIHIMMYLMCVSNDVSMWTIDDQHILRKRKSLCREWFQSNYMRKQQCEQEPQSLVCLVYVNMWMYLWDLKHCTPYFIHNHFIITFDGCTSKLVQIFFSLFFIFISFDIRNMLPTSAWFNCTHAECSQWCLFLNNPTMTRTSFSREKLSMEGRISFKLHEETIHKL